MACSGSATCLNVARGGFEINAREEPEMYIILAYSPMLIA